ncbi:mandelate racemase/muconate lactonizing enzyme family protein [Flagellimonas pacifica]|nr:mandelate racemase/muconate lactonizing enzyme family protein [Allomuricauda parva]
MKITDIKVHIVGDVDHVDPKREPIESLAIVRVETDVGICGFAESFRVPPGVAIATMNGDQSFFGKVIIGQEIVHPEFIWQKMYDSMMHFNRRGWAIMCLGAIDIAIWDIYGKYLNQPVYKLLGGAHRCYYQTPESSPSIEVTPYCTVISSEWDNKRMIETQIENCLVLKELGYRAIKVEPLMSTSARIIELVTKVREAIGADMMLSVDVGYRFNDVASAFKACQALEELNIYFFETPFPVDSYLPYAELAKKTTIPIAMGEHAVTRFECLHMIEYGGVSVVQPYINTVGGITEAKRIVDNAKDKGASVIPGNWSTQINGCAAVHLAAYSQISPYIEYAPAEIYNAPLRSEIQKLGFPVVDGVIKLPEIPGIGFDVPDELIKEFKLEL